MGRGAKEKGRKEGFLSGPRPCTYSFPFRHAPPWELGLLPPQVAAEDSQSSGRLTVRAAVFLGSGRRGRPSKLGSIQQPPEPALSRGLRSRSRAPALGVGAFPGADASPAGWRRSWCGAGCDQRHQRGTCSTGSRRGSCLRLQGQRAREVSRWETGSSLATYSVWPWKNVFPSLALNFPIWAVRESHLWMSADPPSCSLLASGRKCSWIWTLKCQYRGGNTRGFPQHREGGKELPPWPPAQVGV